MNGERNIDCKTSIDKREKETMKMEIRDESEDETHEGFRLEYVPTAPDMTKVFEAIAKHTDAITKLVLNMQMEEYIKR